MSPEIFPIAPVAQSSGWFPAGITAFCIIMSLLVTGAMIFAWKSVDGVKHAAFHIDADGLHIKSFPFSRTIPFAEMALAQAEVVDLANHPELHLRRRSRGASLGSLKAGWFRLRNKTKALVFLTTMQRVAVIPTTQGFQLLLSPADPERFLERLRAQAG